MRNDTRYTTAMARPSNRSRGNGKRKTAIGVGLIFVAVVALTVFLLVQIFSKNIVIVPGEITYDQSVTEKEKQWLQEKLADYKAPEDMTVSASNKSVDYQVGTSEVVLDVLVPVTNFYDSSSNISLTDVQDYDLVSVQDLSPERRVLAIDGQYYFDDYAHGAIYRVLNFSSDKAQGAIEKISEGRSVGLKKDEVLSFNQTGVTALTRMMLKTLYQVGDGAFFAEKVKDFLASSDLTHISNEVSFANDCSVSSDMKLCSDPRMFSAVAAIGTDIVELTGNHNNDWGTTANLNTIQQYDANNMLTFGGGENEEDAAIPLEISEKGNNITLIGINYSTSSKANGEGASGSSPGANIYNATRDTALIKEAKAQGRYVIVDVQFAECYCYPDDGYEMPECDYPISGQQEFFRGLIDDGADMVIGTQAHQPQTYEIYDGKPIYYGLGNLFFDQTYWPGTERSIILTHYFKEGKLLQTRITPTAYGSNYQTALMDGTTATSFLGRLIAASSRGK